MIRLNDHLFRPDIIAHMQIMTDGTRYVIAVEYGDKEVMVPYFNREAAELALEEAQDMITRFIMPWDDDDGLEDPAS